MTEAAVGTVVDANVLLDILTEDPAWIEWSSQALADAADSGPLVINPVVYAEVSVRFSSIEDLDAALPGAAFVREPIPWPAAFLAGKCFVEYRRRGGVRRSPPPDFLIGAHAAVRGLRLLTRDRRGIARISRRCRSWRPELTAPARGRPASCRTPARRRAGA